MGKRKDSLRAEPDREPRTQYAALCWRRGASGGVEVLLITSRETRRWVIPKGWPIRTMKPGPSAAREAFEEAGVEGEVSKKPVGVYHYDKRLRSGRLQHVRVPVYALGVSRELDSWPEMAERERAWLAPAEAAERVEEPELQSLIRRFAP
jgi:8-oxo-dGTP pyrophosphatase MutT (NUDIX family)